MGSTSHSNSISAHGHGNFLTPAVLICSCSALMLLFYFVSNWVVPELLMKRLQPKAEDQEASAAASMLFSGDATDGQSDGDASRPKIRLKVTKKKKKNKKAPVEI
jgi:hypothetical protein